VSFPKTQLSSGSFFIASLFKSDFSYSRAPVNKIITEHNVVNDQT